MSVFPKMSDCSFKLASCLERVREISKIKILHQNVSHDFTMYFRCQPFCLGSLCTLMNAIIQASILVLIYCLRVCLRCQCNTDLQLTPTQQTYQHTDLWSQQPSRKNSQLDVDREENWIPTVLTERSFRKKCASQLSQDN